MKKKLVLATVMSLVIATCVTTALSAAVTPANGNDVILPDGNVYQANDDGSYSLIPDVATANAMKLDWNALVLVDELPGPVGAPFPSVVTLTNARVTTSADVKVTPANGLDVILPDGRVFQENADGSYSLIPDVATANAMKLVWNELEQVDELPGPEGTPFPSVLG